MIFRLVSFRKKHTTVTTIHYHEPVSARWAEVHLIQPLIAVSVRASNAPASNAWRPSFWSIRKTCLWRIRPILIRRVVFSYPCWRLLLYYRCAAEEDIAIHDLSLPDHGLNSNWQRVVILPSSYHRNQEITIFLPFQILCQQCPQCNHWVSSLPHVRIDASVSREGL